jgi:hypothetical protein
MCKLQRGASIFQGLALRGVATCYVALRQNAYSQFSFIFGCTPGDAFVSRTLVENKRESVPAQPT